MQDVSNLAFKWIDEVDGKEPVTIVTIAICKDGTIPFALHLSDKSNDLATAHAITRVLDQVVNNLRVTLAQAQAAIEAAEAPKH